MKSLKKIIFIISLISTSIAGATTPRSTAMNPEVPKKVKFADGSIDLDRTDLFERMDRELTAISNTHSNTLLTIKRANRYFPQIIPILRQEGVPEDLVYLACIESSLNPRAVSGAKAGGLWQFMPATGREYGLEVNDYVDERFHVEKATRAACRYMKNAFAKFGNWESAAASYNCGMGRISNELQSQQVATAHDLWLNDETSRYMFRLLAMKMIVEHPGRYGFHFTPDQLYQPIPYTTVEVSEPVEDWPTWALEHGITYLTLREHNPWIRAKSLPNKTGKTYIVNIPEQDQLYRSKQKRRVYNHNWIEK